MASDRPQEPAKPRILNTDVPLAVGQLFYEDHRDGKKQIHSCPFQFNPTELERSRTIRFTRSPTGNTLEEPGSDKDPRPPDTNPRNHFKHKFTRKPDPWDMTLSLRFDASRPVFATPTPMPQRTSPDNLAFSVDVAVSTTEPALPAPSPGTLFATPAASVSASLSTSLSATDGDKGTLQSHFKDEIARINRTMRFFEALAEPYPMTRENQRLENANETSPPPFLTLAFGVRSWVCAVKSVRIKEEDYTYDLYPRRFEVTLNLEVVETTRQVDLGKTGATG